MIFTSDLKALPPSCQPSILTSITSVQPLVTDLHHVLGVVSLPCCSPGHKSKVRSALNFPEGDEEKSEEKSKPELEDQADFGGQEGEEPVGFTDGDFILEDQQLHTHTHDQSA